MKAEKRKELEGLVIVFWSTLICLSAVMFLLHKPFLAAVCSSTGAILLCWFFKRKTKRVRHPKLYAFGRTLIITGCVLSFVAAILMLVIYLFNL